MIDTGFLDANGLDPLPGSLTSLGIGLAILANIGFKTALVSGSAERGSVCARRRGCCSPRPASAARYS